MSVMIYKGYTGRFEYDPDADIFHGQIIGTRDVITFQGRSIDELKQAIADSVDVYLEYCAKKGKTPDKAYSGCFNVRIAPEIHQKIAQEAASEGISLNSWVSGAITQRLATAGHSA